MSGTAVADLKTSDILSKYFYLTAIHRYLRLSFDWCNYVCVSLDKNNRKLLFFSVCNIYEFCFVECGLMAISPQMSVGWLKMQDRKMTDKLCSCCKIKQRIKIRLSCSHHQYKLRWTCLGVRPAIQHLILQSSMLTFHYIVSRNYGCHVHSSVSSGLTERLLIHCLLMYATKLLHTFHVFTVISNLWPNVSECYWQPAQFHQEEATVGWQTTHDFLRLDSPDTHLWGPFWLGAWQLLEHRLIKPATSAVTVPKTSCKTDTSASSKSAMAYDGLLGLWRELHTAVRLVFTCVSCAVQRQLYVGTVSKRLNILSCFLHQTIARSF